MAVLECVNVLKKVSGTKDDRRETQHSLVHKVIQDEL